MKEVRDIRAGNWDERIRMEEEKREIAEESSEEADSDMEEEERMEKGKLQ